MTLLECIQGLIDNISVTDRQEENIKGSLSNLDHHLQDEDNDLDVINTFTNGSYERNTIIRPLNDIDLFAVLSRDAWKDENGNPPNPQSVLTKIKNYLNDQPDYKDKVSQDRPCVTVKLSDKNFDVLPSFEEFGGGYLIPNHDLKSWTYSYPEQLTTNLDNIHRQRNYKIKPTIKAIKYWNREKGKLIPSYHIEETAINIFTLNDFTNFEQSIRIWFNNAESYLQSSKFKSYDDHTTSINRIKKVKGKLNEAKKKYDDGKEDEAIQIWKDIFGKEFPTVDIDEAKNFSKSLSEGSLKISTAGTLSTSAGTAISASKGFSVTFLRNKYYNSDIQIHAMKSRYPQFKAKKRGQYDIDFVGDLLVKPVFPVYTVSITYRGNLRPLVKVIRPELVADPPHFYKESRSLCLYHPKNYHWIKEKLIAADIVHWTAAWIYFYEVWLQKVYGMARRQSMARIY